MTKTSYFLRGITAKGFVQFYDELIRKMDHVLYIEGGTTAINQTFFHEIINKYGEVEKLEYVYNHIQPDLLEAVIFSNRKIAIVDRAKMGSKRTVNFPKFKEHLLYIGDIYDDETLLEHEAKLYELYEKIDNLYDEALNHFETGYSIYSGIEKIYFKYMDVDKANEETEKLIASIFQHVYLNKQTEQVHRYLGGATSKGPVDFIPELTDDVNRRIFIKGRAGTGKSTILKKMIAEGEKRGFDMEIYHCGFDPDSIDMLIFRELNLALFDATDPHSHEPVKSNDEIYDTYELFIKENPGDAELNEINSLHSKYKNEMKLGTESLNNIKEQQEAIDSIFKSAVKDDKLKEICVEVDRWIGAILN